MWSASHISHAEGELSLQLHSSQSRPVTRVRPVLGNIVNLPHVAASQVRHACSLEAVEEPSQKNQAASAQDGLMDGIGLHGENAQAANSESAGEYWKDIYSHLREEEGSYCVQPNYMDAQDDVTPRLRSILVDWLVEVHMKYKFKSETLFLATSVLDRFLAKKRTARTKLQLVGLAATLIAAKYEEIHPPEVRDLVYICDRYYTGDEIRKMELAILNVIEFHVCVPTVVHFLDAYCLVNDEDSATAIAEGASSPGNQTRGTVFASSVVQGRGPQSARHGEVHSSSISLAGWPQGSITRLQGVGGNGYAAQTTAPRASGVPGMMLPTPTPTHSGEVQRQMAQYLAELALVEVRMLRYPPSILAAAAVFLSKKLLKEQPSLPLTMASREASINNCIKDLTVLVEGAAGGSLQAVRKKFSYAKTHSVATLTESFAAMSV